MAKKKKQTGKKEALLNNIKELDAFADQLMMMEEYPDRLKGSSIKENLEYIKEIVNESLL